MVVIIAHRGASGHAPENTATAFLKAIEMKADMIEFDVSVTKDHIPVIFHDRKMHRLTGKKGELKDYTYDEVRQFDIGSWFHADFSYERILTLSEGLEFLKSRKVNVEIKPEAVGHELQILKAIKDVKKPSDVLISSHDERIIERLRRADQEIRLATVAVILWRERLKKTLKLGGYSIHPRTSVISHRLVKTAHENNLNVYTWVVNTAKDMESCLRLGVDGIFTDYPDRMRRHLDAMR